MIIRNQDGQMMNEQSVITTVEEITDDEWRFIFIESGLIDELIMEYRVSVVEKSTDRLYNNDEYEQKTLITKDEVREILDKNYRKLSIPEMWKLGFSTTEDVYSID